MKNLKIAFLSRDLPKQHPNGVSCQVDLLANELCRKGHDVTVFSLDEKPNNSIYKIVNPPSPVKENRFYRLFKPALFFAAQDYSSFDIIHAHGDDYLLKSKKPIVRTFYGSALWEAIYDNRIKYRIRQLFFYPLEWISAVKSNKSIGISKTTKSAIPIIDCIIPCAVDTNLFKQNDNKTDFPSILFVGNLSGRKRGWELVKIFKEEVLPFNPDAVLYLVASEIVPEMPNIKVLSSISSSDLSRLYQQCWILCATSTYEGFGVPVIEAFASGTAVISFRNKGSKEIISHYKNGILCNLKDMGVNIRFLINNKEQRKSFINAGIDSVKDFSIQVIAQKHERIYEQVLFA